MKNVDTFTQRTVCSIVDGLISIQGMEKSMRITRNTITDNEGIYMVEFKADSQSEIRGELRAIFFENLVKRNSPPSPQVSVRELPRYETRIYSHPSRFNIFRPRPV